VLSLQKSRGGRSFHGAGLSVVLPESTRNAKSGETVNFFSGSLQSNDNKGLGVGNIDASIED
jgi:hypothetical protein